MVAEVDFVGIRPVELDELKKIGNSTIVREIRIDQNASREGGSSEMGVDVGGRCSVY